MQGLADNYLAQDVDYMSITVDEWEKVWGNAWDFSKKRTYNNGFNLPRCLPKTRGYERKLTSGSETADQISNEGCFKLKNARGKQNCSWVGYSTYSHAAQSLQNDPGDIILGWAVNDEISAYQQVLTEAITQNTRRMMYNIYLGILHKVQSHAREYLMPATLQLYAHEAEWHKDKPFEFNAMKLLKFDVDVEALEGNQA
jgi:hypothetical protein